MNLKVFCLRMKSSIIHTICISTIYISSCGMFAYRDVTSAVTTSAFGGGGECVEFFNEVEKMFCVFIVRSEVASKGLDEMSNVGREMLTITPRNKRVETAAWFLNFG